MTAVLKPKAWMRKWAFDGEVPRKVLNSNKRMAWPGKFRLLPITENKCLPDDVPLFGPAPHVALTDALPELPDRAALGGSSLGDAYALYTREQVEAYARQYAQQCIEARTAELEQECRALSALVSEQDAKLAEIEARNQQGDAVRVNFMASDKCIIDTEESTGATRYWLSWPYSYTEQEITYGTPREAIDAAIEQRKADKKGDV